MPRGEDEAHEEDEPGRRARGGESASHRKSLLPNRRGLGSESDSESPSLYIRSGSTGPPVHPSSLKLSPSKQRDAMDAYDRYVIRRGDRMIVVRRRRPPPVTRNFDFDDEDHGYDRRYEAPYLPDTWSPPRDLSDPDGGHESALATEAAIQGLPEVTPPNKLLLPADQCAVCLMDFDPGDKLRAMPCAHAFHEQCIFRWLRRTAVCPLCRHPLPIQEKDE